MDAALSWLLEPIAEDAPCGENLEDTQLLASFDAYRLFGQMSPLGDDVDWRELRSSAKDALAKSKDFRLLAYYALARMRIEGLYAFCDTLAVAGHWLEAYPDAVYPLVDDDAILRRNAINNFSDRMASIDALRRAHFVRNPAVGAFSLRDFEIATGQLAPVAAGEGAAEAAAPSESLIRGALSAADGEELAASSASLGAAIESLLKLDRLMRDAGGSEAAPETESLLVPLRRIHSLLADELGNRSAASGAAAGANGEAAGAGGTAVIGVGSIRSRDDAARALDAVAEFFRKNEPSSPVPMVVERAKRLISMSFLEVLRDLAPDGLDEARRIGGIRDE
jgi:type VI secretion system protein ImpA